MAVTENLLMNTNITKYKLYCYALPVRFELCRGLGRPFSVALELNFDPFGCVNIYCTKEEYVPVTLKSPVQFTLN